ncbi:MAG: galactokinase [Bacteroidales bacterium]|nr:galactokinase [Bacteroidales bacterium]
MKQKISKLFQEKFKTDKIPQVYFAPGRVNIIGEHIDYNGGHVLPFAINLGTYAAATLRDDDIINFLSVNFEEQISVKISELDYNQAHKWANYPKGVLKLIIDAKFHIDKGFDVLFWGNLPTGAGLSSSASIELVTAVMISDLFKYGITQLDKVKISQMAENNYMGVKCGIMDQFAIGMGKKDYAILLNTSTLNYEYIPLILENHSIIVVNSMKKRELVDSEFNTRQNECKTGLKLLQKELIINNLCEIDYVTFLRNKHLIEDEIIQKRVKHVITENERTISLAEALKNNNLFDIKTPMCKSHESLRDNYQVTGFELDVLVDIINKQDGVLAGRMTGAGFGGCAIAIVQNKFVTNFISNVKEEYKKITNLEAEFYNVKSEDGARKILND